MISISRNFKLTEGTAPYTAVFSIDDSCASVENAVVESYRVAGVDYLENIFYFDNSACIDSSTITLTVTDAEGCVKIKTFQLDDPCSVQITSVYSPEPYRFAALVIGGINNQYSWSYDKTVFKEKTASKSLELNLELINPSPPTTTDITLTVTSNNNCISTYTYSYNIAIPQANVYNTLATCVSDDYIAPLKIAGLKYATPTLYLSLLNNVNTDMDWSTLEITSIPTGVTPYYPEEDQVMFLVEEQVATGVYTMAWRVKSNDGIYSSYGNINMVVSACTDVNFTIDNSTYQIDCTAIVGDTFEIPLYEILPNGIDIDWSTFTFLTIPAYTSSLIAQSFDTLGRPVINYKIPALTGVDSFGFQVCDTDGRCTTGTIITVLLDCSQAPTAGNITTCLACSKSIEVDAVAAVVSTNGGVLNPSSIEITIANPNITAVSTTDGKIVITADDEFQTSGVGFVVLTYKISNYNGSQSTSASVTLTGYCAGANMEVNICADVMDGIGANPDTPYTLMNTNSPTSPSGGWAVQSAPTGVSISPPASYNSSFDMTGKPNGTYVLRYTVTGGVDACNQYKDLTIYKTTQTAVVNDDCTGAIQLQNQKLNPFILNQDLRESCPGLEAATLSATAIPGSWGASAKFGDKWYKVSSPASGTLTNMEVKVDGSSYTDGITQPLLEINETACGTSIDSTVGVGNTAVINVGGSFAASRDFWFRVAAYDGQEGKFDLSILFT